MEGHSWQLALVPRTGWDPPMSAPIITTQGDDSAGVPIKEPPTLVSRFPSWRPLIGQKGPGLPLIGRHWLCCCSVQMSSGHRYQVHIRAEFNILTLSNSNTSLSQIDCHRLSGSHIPQVYFGFQYKYNCWRYFNLSPIVLDPGLGACRDNEKWQTNSINFLVH